MIIIRKVSDGFGWLGNMSPFPVTHEGREFKTTEALFQTLRFNDPTVIDLIRQQKSPMAAKMVAKKHRSAMVVEPMSEMDLDNMRLVLRLKLQQHPPLREALLATGEQMIVEDCTKRPHGSGLFWGAADRDGQWVGDNWLGKLWMELRLEMQLMIEGKGNGQ